MALGTLVPLRGTAGCQRFCKAPSSLQQAWDTAVAGGAREGWQQWGAVGGDRQPVGTVGAGITRPAV